VELKPGYKQTEVGMIPEDWGSTTVTGIASSVRNAIVGGPFGSDLVSTDYVEDGVPVIRGQNMGQKRLSGEFVFVSHAKAISLESNLARYNDLVFTQRGTLGQVSLVPKSTFDRYLVSQSQMKLTVNQRVANPEFYYYVFSSSEQQEYIRKNTIQTGVPHINLGILRHVPISCPSLLEQEAIAQALSDADALIESLEQLIAKKRQVKQGAMQELLTGKKRLEGFSGEWEVKKLGEVCEIVMGQSPSSSAYNISGIGLPLIQGNADIDNRKTIRRIFTTQITKRGRSGDILMSVRAPVGEISRAEFDICLGRGVCAIRFGNNFMYHLLIFLEPTWAKLSKGSTFDSVNSADVKSLEIELPIDVEEQTAIASILSDMDAEIVTLETKLEKARQVKQGMMHNLLTGRIRLV
jgi:type I restriction enzyme, S subunit